MKNTTRKLLVALLLVFTMLMSLVTVSSFAAEGDTVTIYFQNNWMWSNVSVHYWGDGETTWPGNPMTVVGQDGGYDVYSAEIPAGVEGIVINGIKDDGSGNLDKTPDITEGIVDGAGWKMEWADGNLAVAYTYAGNDTPVTPPVTPDDPEVKPDDSFGAPSADFVDSFGSYTVAGTAGLCGSEWDTANTANDLVKGEDGNYSITFTAVPAGEHKFKVAADHQWTNAWPGADYTFTLSESCDVTIKFNPQSQKVLVVADKLTNNVIPTDGDYTVVGTSALCYTDWNLTDTYNNMTLNTETGLYEKTFTGIPAGIYELKVVYNHSYDTSWGGDYGDYGNFAITTEAEYDITVTFDPATGTIAFYTSESTGPDTDRPLPEKPDIDTSKTITLYLNNSKNWEKPMVYYWTNGASDQNAAWPGQEMEWDGEKLVYYVVVPTYYLNIIFNDGNGTQTADLAIPGDNYIFDNTTNEWSDMKDFVPPAQPENTTEEVTVHVKDSLGWGDMYIYFWDMNGLESAAWPGVPMELGEDGFYTYTIPAGFWQVIFNNGGSWEDGTLQQTPDLIIPTDGKTYIDNGASVLDNDGVADDNKAWYKLGEEIPDSEAPEQGGDTTPKPDVPKGEMTFLQKIAKALLLWLRSMEEFFLNMFSGKK